VESFIKYVLGEMRVFAEAPVTFIVALLVLGGVVWWLLDWRYSGIVSNRDGTISNRDSEISLLRGQRDDYKEKLSGASPEQAKAKIEALESRLAQLEPRRTTQDQRNKLLEKLRLPSNIDYLVEIARDASTPDGVQYASDFLGVFHEAGWRTSAPIVMGIGNLPLAAGLIVQVSSLANPPSEGKTVLDALKYAGIPFAAQEIGPIPPAHEGLPPRAQVKMLITNRMSQ
jgi:hypothetical protein